MPINFGLNQNKCDWVVRELSFYPKVPLGFARAPRKRPNPVSLFWSDHPHQRVKDPFNGLQINKVSAASPCSTNYKDILRQLYCRDAMSHLKIQRAGCTTNRLQHPKKAHCSDPPPHCLSQSLNPDVTLTPPSLHS